MAPLARGAAAGVAGRLAGAAAVRVARAEALAAVAAAVAAGNPVDVHRLHALRHEARHYTLAMPQPGPPRSHSSAAQHTCRGGG